MPWTNVGKPAESSVMVLDSSAGQPFGLLIAITSTLSATSSTTSGWGNISKPAGGGWTNLSKPTVDGFIKVTKPTD